MPATNKDREQQKIFFAQSEAGEDSPGLVPSRRQQLPDEYDIHYPAIEAPEAPVYRWRKKLLSSELKKIKQPVTSVGYSAGGTMVLKYLSDGKPEIVSPALFSAATPHWEENGRRVKDFLLKENFETGLKPIVSICSCPCAKDVIVPFEHLNFYQATFPPSAVSILNGSDHPFTARLPQLASDIKLLKYQTQA